jgi:hypothetical protein
MVGCSKTGGPSSIAGWKPKFLGGAPKEGSAEAFMASGQLPEQKLTVEHGKGSQPIENSNSILDDAPPAGTFPAGYVPPNVQKFNLSEMPGGM